MNMVSHNALQILSERATRYVAENTLATEEAVKHALILPFIQALGYDCFDPTEVIPEYVADYGMKRGEKVDYALQHSAVVSILVEAKELGNSLSQVEAGQLSRYFANSDARIGILTNGVRYLFFSDLEAPNVMDADPFLEIDLTALDARAMVQLEHFSKRQFNADAATAAAANMKYISGMKAYLSEQFSHPEESFVRLMAKAVHNGPMSQKKLESFTGLTKLACQSYLQDRISRTLHRATELTETCENNQDTDESPEGATRENDSPRTINTTADELAAHGMVAQLLADAGIVTADRVAIRDTTSYCGILLDDNRNKPICRFRFSNSSKRICLFDGTRDPQKSNQWIEERHELNELHDIANYAPALISRVKQLLEST